jgi:hypothetical protein
MAATITVAASYTTSRGTTRFAPAMAPSAWTRSTAICSTARPVLSSRPLAASIH